MRKAAYVLVSIAAAIFIANWLWANFTAFNDAHAGAEAIQAALIQDRTTTNFPQCRERWAGNAIMIKGCDANARQGYEALSAAWSDPALSAESRGQIAICWTNNQTRSGPDWMLIGGCAELYDSRARD